MAKEDKKALKEKWKLKNQWGSLSPTIKGVLIGGTLAGPPGAFIGGGFGLARKHYRYAKARFHPVRHLNKG